MEFIHVLRRGEVFRLWLAQVISAIGDRFFDIAVVWIATQQIGAEAGGVILAGTVSSLVFGLLGGIYADRWNRRRTMILTDVIRAAVLFVVVLIVVTGTLKLWHLAVAMAILSALNSLFEPTLYASLPIIVPDMRGLQATNALMDVTWRLSMSIGPAIAGYLLALLPIGTLFFVDALTFLFSAIAVMSLGLRYQWKPERTTPHSSHILDDLKGAVQLVLAHRVLAWGLLMGIMVGNVVWSLVFTIGVPLMVSETLNGDSRTFGLIVTSYGIGNVASNFLIGNMVIRRRIMYLFGGNVILGLGFLGLSVAPSLPLAMMCAFFAATGGPMTDIMLLIILQSELPSHSIGKIYSLRLIMAEIGHGVGLGLAVPLYSLVSIPVGMAFGAFLMMFSGLVGLARFGIDSEAFINQ